MTDHDALVAAICAEPDEDTLRLVFADFLEETGEPDRAAFIRAQVELARTPAWEPFAVFCRWRRRDWLTGKPFLGSLPVLDHPLARWNEHPFRRGLGWHLDLGSLLVWKHYESRVVDRAPVGAIHLWGSNTIDQFREFAQSRLIARLRELHLATNPVEPLRTLREEPAACGITDIHFEQASSPGLPFVVEDLLASPLGRAARGLHFRMGYEALDDLIEALEPAETLERLSLTTMGITDVLVERLLRTRAANRITDLELGNNPLGASGLAILLNNLPQSIHTLGLSRTGAAGPGFDLFERAAAVASLRRLDLSDNPLSPRAARALSRSPLLTGLRSLELARCRVGDREMRWFTRAKFWPNLVELNLRDNPISRAGIRHLLDAPVPVDLAALVLTEALVQAEMRSELRQKYGDRVVFVVPLGGAITPG